MGHCNCRVEHVVPRATLTVETALAWMGPGFWWMLTVALMSTLTLSKCLLSASCASWPWGCRRDGDTLAVPLVFSKPYS